MFYGHKLLIVFNKFHRKRENILFSSTHLYQFYLKQNHQSNYLYRYAYDENRKTFLHDFFRLDINEEDILESNFRKILMNASDFLI